MKSAWRAMKKFPSISNRNFRALPKERREAILNNLHQSHQEVYGGADAMRHVGETNPITGRKGTTNMHQIPSLMSGSSLENAVGKDGRIKISEIEKLANSKNISRSERESIQGALEKVKKGEDGKVDYNMLRQQSSSDEFSKSPAVQHKLYGLNVLGYEHGPPRKTDWMGNVLPPDHLDPDNFDAISAMNPRVTKIQSSSPGLSEMKHSDHWGSTEDIGHYRSFEDPNDPAVLYISEMQSDPLQRMDRKLPDDSFVKEHALIPAGKDQAGAPVLTSRQKNLLDNQDEFLISQVLGNEARNFDRIRFPTGETTGTIQYYGNQDRFRVMSEEAVERSEDELLELLYDNYDKYSPKDVGELTPSSFKRVLEKQTTMEPTELGVIKFINEVEAESGLSLQDIEYMLDEVDYLVDALPADGGQAVPEIGKKMYVEAHEAAKDVIDQTHGRELRDLRNWFGVYDEEELAVEMSKDFAGKIHSYGRSATVKTEQQALVDSYGASAEAQAAIMKGYDNLPKALKKHGLNSKKVTDPTGNTWWEIDVPAKLGAGVGEIRAFKEGGRFRILKKQL